MDQSLRELDISEKYNKAGQKSSEALNNLQICPKTLDVAKKLHYNQNRSFFKLQNEGCRNEAQDQ